MLLFCPGPKWMFELYLFNDNTRPSGHINCPKQYSDLLLYLWTNCQVRWYCHVVGMGWNQVQICISWGLVKMRNCIGYLTIISDRNIQFLPETRQCKPLESSQSESSMSHLCTCIIRHHLSVIVYTSRACGQWPVSYRNGGRRSVVLGIRHETLRSWYSQCEVG